MKSILTVCVVAVCLQQKLITVAFGQNVTVTTGIGNITGQTETVSFNGTRHTLLSFLGIPFAEPPTGSRRFHKPLKKSPFKETFRADTMPPVCYQDTSGLEMVGIDVDSLVQAEDCLFLNIFVPGQQINVNTPSAVMIWIYGGGFQTGYQDWYDGKAFATLNDVILVTFNYRLAVFGFLSTAENNFSGNYGLWDQRMAIQWVHDHIDNFGGDPNRVTIFGESAGSASIIYQALYEDNQGLFQRVIAQSGSVNNGWAYEKNPTEKYLQFAKDSGCLRDYHMDIINCLRDIPPDKLNLQARFVPVVDGEFVKINPVDLLLNKTDAALKLLDIFGYYDVMIGVTSDEGGAMLNEVDRVATERGENVSEGYSISIFENIGIERALAYAFQANSSLLQAAIVNEYIDWSDPENKHLIMQRTIDMSSDVVINAGVVRTANTHSAIEGDGTLYFYVFDYKTNLSFYYDERYPGANHADEIMYMLGFPKGYASLFFNGSFEDPAMVLSQVDLVLSRHMMQYWTNFAKTGNPNDGGEGNPSNLTYWPEYDYRTQKYIRFTSNVTSFPVESRYAASRVHFWNALVPKLEESCYTECPKCENISVGKAQATSPNIFQVYLIALIFGLVVTVLES